MLVRVRMRMSVSMRMRMREGLSGSGSPLTGRDLSASEWAEGAAGNLWKRMPEERA